MIGRCQNYLFDALFLPAKIKTIPLRTPAIATELYNRGGALISTHNNNPETIKRGMVQLDLAIEIFKDNNLLEQASCAAVLAAKARIDLALIEKKDGKELLGEAKKLLKFAGPHIQKNKRLRGQYNSLLASIGRKRKTKK